MASLDLLINSFLPSFLHLFICLLALSSYDISNKNKKKLTFVIMPYVVQPKQFPNINAHGLFLDKQTNRQTYIQTYNNNNNNNRKERKNKMIVVYVNLQLIGHCIVMHTVPFHSNPFHSSFVVRLLTLTTRVNNT